MVALCTGYEPFGDDDENPSAAVARALDGRRIAGHDVVGRVLPVAFDEVRSELATLVDEHDPAVVVGTGLAAGRAGVSLERVGVNVDDAVTTPDNVGAAPEATPIDPDGPDARFATLPLAETVTTLLEAGIPARLSNTAGTHCCNHHLYVTRGLLVERTERDGADGADDGPVPSGFVHVPLTPSMAARKAAGDGAHRGGSVRPSLPLDLLVEAVTVVIRTAVAAGPDRRGP